MYGWQMQRAVTRVGFWKHRPFSTARLIVMQEIQGWVCLKSPSWQILAASCKEQNVTELDLATSTWNAQESVQTTSTLVLHMWDRFDILTPMTIHVVRRYNDEHLHSARSWHLFTFYIQIFYICMF